MTMSGVNRTGKVYLTLAILTIVIVAAIITRLAAPKPVNAQDQRFESSRAVFAALHFRELREERDLDEALGAMSIKTLGAVDQSSSEGLKKMVQEFLSLYCLNGSAELYSQWRSAQGYRLRSRSEIDADGWTIDDSHDFVMTFSDGNQLASTASASIDNEFAFFWNVSRQIGAGANAPRKICADARGCTATISLVPQSARAQLSLNGGLDATQWYGGISTGGRRWWKRNQELAPGNQPVHKAEVGILLEFANGSRRPLFLSATCIHPPDGWVLDGARVANYPRSEPVWPPEY